MTTWTEPKESMPGVGVRVLVSAQHRLPVIAYCDARGQWWKDGGDNERLDWPTHWTRLPQFA